MPQKLNNAKDKCINKINGSINKSDTPIPLPQSKVLEKQVDVIEKQMKTQVLEKQECKCAKQTQRVGKRSKKKEKNKNSDMKNIEPGKPRKTKQFNNIARNNLGHRKFIPDISVIRRVLNLLATASTSKNELVDSRA
jgi:hypothetical protein